MLSTPSRDRNYRHFLRLNAGFAWHTARHLFAARFVSLLLSLMGFTLIAWGQWRWFEEVAVVTSGAEYVIAGLFLVLIGLHPSLIVPHQQPLFELDRSPYALRLWQIPLAIAGALIVFRTADRALSEQEYVWSLLGMWGLGVLLVLLGLVPLRSTVAWGRMVARSLSDEPWTWSLVGWLFVFGFLVRVAWLDTSPAIFAGDEAQFAQEAVGVKDFLNWHYNPFQLGNWHHPRTYHTLIGLSIEIFGQTASAARFPAAVFGALTVPAMYVLGRRMFSPAIGWVAALFMLTFPVHVQFSRTGMDMTGDPFFVALAFAFFVRAMRVDDRFEAALAGIALGLSQYFYFAGRIAVFLLGAYVALLVLRNWRGAWRRAGVLVTLAVLLVVTAGPNVYAMINDEARSFSPRLAQVSIWETGEVARARDEGRLAEYIGQQVQRGLLAYVLYQDESDIYGRYTPVLGWFAGVPFMIGVAVMLRRWRDPRSLMFLLWPLATGLAGGALLIDPPHYPRYISATPALAIGVAFGVVWVGIVLHALVAGVVRAMPRVSAGWLRAQPCAVPLVLAVVLMIANLASYTFDYMPQTDKLLYGRNTQQLNKVVRIIDRFDGRYNVRRFSSLYLDLDGTDLVRYLTPENAGQEYWHDITDWRSYLLPGRYAFVIAPHRYDEIVPVLEAEFPDGSLEAYTETDTDEVLIYVYYATISEDLARQEVEADD